MTVFVDRTKEEIKNSPGYDENLFNDPAYRNQFGRYFGGGARS